MRRWFVGGLLLALALAGCNEGVSPEAYGGVDLNAAAPASAEPPEGEARSANPRSPAADSEAAEGIPAALQSRKIVYTGQLEVQCNQLAPALAEARQIVTQAGGYISQLEQSGGTTSRQASLTFRIPADRFEATLDALGKLGDVQRRSLSSNDVTDQWVDLDARLRNLKAEEKRLLAILAQASKVSDLLEVERELARVRGEAERIEGQFRRLNDQVTLSTIDLHLRLPADREATAESGSWLKGQIADAAATFVTLGKAVVSVLIHLLFLSPLVLLPLLLTYWIIRWLGRRKR